MSRRTTGFADTGSVLIGAAPSYHEMLRAGYSHVEAMAEVDVPVVPPKKRRRRAGGSQVVETAADPTSYHELLRAGYSHVDAMTRVNIVGM